MNETVRFGRIAGIPVGAHWSVLLMAVVVSNILASTALPELAPGHSAMAYWSTAVLVALVFVASLLAHELAHALAALRYRLPVQRITLWMLGGVSVLGGDAATPRAAFLIAAAGPATSIGLGLLGGGAGLLVRAAGAPDLVESSLWWLAVMNVALGLFNLLPGVPLDGGRILRALLWHWSGDADRATVRASFAGRLVGGVVAAAGVLELVNGDAGGFWLIAVGYVIVLAAIGEGRQAKAHGTTAAQLVRPAELIGSRSTPIDQFVVQALGARQLVFPIVGPDDVPTGVVSMARIASVPADVRSTTRLGDIQIPLEQVPVVTPRTPLAELRRMLRTADQIALVVDGARLVGIVTGYDVAGASSARP